MSSSLSAIPSDDDPFQAMKPSPARPTSVFEHASYRPIENTIIAESSTAHRKRRTIATVSISPAKLPDHLNRTFKRAREATPIYEDAADQNIELDVEAANSVPGASTAPADPIAATTTDDAMSAQYFADDERRDRTIAQAETSEKEEPSVLFSEQEPARTEATEAMEDSGMIEDDENTMVDVPEPAPSQSGLSRRRSATQPDPRPQPGVAQGQANAEDHADISWMDVSSDGIEDLRDWLDPFMVQPEFADYLAELPNDQARKRLIAVQRRLARIRRDGMADYGEDEEEEVGSNYIRTTREQLADALAAGHQEDEVEYHSGDTEDFEMDHRPLLERAGVKRDIRAFMDSVPVLAEEDETRRDYQIVDRLGEGELACIWERCVFIDLS